MTSAFVKITLKLITLFVMSVVIETHWMDDMTSSLVQSRIRSKALSILGRVRFRVPYTVRPLQREGSIAEWLLRDARRLHHPVVMAESSCIHSLMV